MAWWRRAWPRGDEGQAAVELALALPIVVLLVLAVVQVVLVGRDQVAVVDAAREGARAASRASGTGADPVAAGSQAARAAAGGLEAPRLSVAVALGPVNVTVTVSYRSPTDVPFAGRLLPDIDLHATVVMRREP